MASSEIDDKLAAGETIIVSGTAVPAAGATGSGSGLGKLIGNVISRRGAVRGADGSIAHGVPADGEGHRIVLTDRRIVLGDPLTGATRWQAERSRVQGVETFRRMQLLAKFRLHFSDGSSAVLMTPSGSTVGELLEQLGRAA